MTVFQYKLTSPLPQTVYDEICQTYVDGKPTFVAANHNGFAHWFEFDFTAQQDTNFKKFLATRLGLYGDDLGQYTVRKEASLVYTTDTPSTLTNIGTTFKNVYTASDGLSFPIDIINYTKVRVQVHWSLIGTGVQSLRIIQLNSPNTILYSFPTLVNGPNNGVITDIDPLLQGITSGQLFVIQAKSTVAADDPVFQGIRVLMK